MAMAAAAQSKSSAAAEEQQPEAQARLGVFFFFGFKYYFSIINFWEINFAVSGDWARISHRAKIGPIEWYQATESTDQSAVFAKLARIKLAFIWHFRFG